MCGCLLEWGICFGRRDGDGAAPAAAPPKPKRRPPPAFLAARLAPEPPAEADDVFGAAALRWAGERAAARTQVAASELDAMFLDHIIDNIGKGVEVYDETMAEHGVKHPEAQRRVRMRAGGGEFL